MISADMMVEVLTRVVSDYADDQMRALLETAVAAFLDEKFEGRTDDQALYDEVVDEVRQRYTGRLLLQQTSGGR